MIAGVERAAPPAVHRPASGLSLLLFRRGELISIRFFDRGEFADIKLDAVAAVQSLEAEDAEVHDDTAGLLYRYSQVLS